MTTTHVAKIDIPPVPAHLQARAAAALERNREAMGGIKAGGYPRINIGGSKFTIIDGDDRTLITTPGTEFAAPMIELAVVGFNPAVSKLFYKGDWNEASADAPDCSADNGIVPDAHIANPPSRACSTCPNNVWGSKITPQGKQVKACSDNKRLAVIPVSDLAQHKALALTITPASLKDWAEYVRTLDSRGIGVELIVTQVYFDPAATFPKLNFKMGRYLTDEEATLVDQRATGDDVRLITSPRQTTSTGPAIPVNAPPAVAPAPHAQAPAAPAPVAPIATPPAAPVVVDPYAGLPPYVEPAVKGAGGLGTPGGDGVYRQLAGKEPPTAEAPAVVDPFEGQPPHVKLAVEGAGGLGTPGGDGVYAALTKKPAPEAPKARKPRGSKAATAPTAPAAPPAAPPVPVQPAGPSHATPSSGTVVTGKGLGGDIDALLAAAMKVPTA